MKIDIKRTDKLYEEFITYMAYRYAIGLAGASGEYAQKRLNAYEIFREMEYDTPEFHQLADEIAQYLKRKKIKDIVDLQKKCKEAELNWFSYHYALGRHSYAATLMYLAGMDIYDIMKTPATPHRRCSGSTSAQTNCRLWRRSRASIITLINGRFSWVSRINVLNLEV